MKKLITIATLALVSLPVYAKDAVSMTVHIINRQSHEQSYDYVAVQGNSAAFGHATANGNTVNGSAYGFSNGSAIGGTFHVEGATFTLQLPDGRLAVVNCNGKYAPFHRATGNTRSCRVPLVDTLTAEFKGDSAKLIWGASIDGSKSESETYKILGIIPAQ